MTETNILKTETKVVLGFPDASPTVSRIKTINKVNVIGTAANRTEAVNKTLELKPDVLFVSSALNGEEDWGLLLLTIPEEIRILMIVESDMNILVKDKLEECGVEFVTDLSVANLEQLILEVEENSEQPEEKEEPEKKEKSLKIAGAKKVRKISSSLNVVQSAAQTAINAVADTAKQTIKNIPSIPKPVDKVLEKFGNVIVVTSKASGTGKSTVSANLAVKLSELGNKVCLIDLTTNQTIHSLFRLPISEDSLKTALETPDSHEGLAYEHRKYQGLSIFANNPDEDTNFNTAGLNNLIKNASSSNDYVIIDTSKPTSDLVLPAAGSVLDVTDMDATHWDSDAKDLENRVLIINKFSESTSIVLVPSKNTNAKRVYVIPLSHDAVMRSAYTGVPVITFEPRINAAFFNISQFIESGGVKNA